MTIFVNLPTLAGNGAGAAVDVSGLALDKTIVYGGDGSNTPPFLAIEISNDAGASSWAAVCSFTNNVAAQTLPLACHWMRAVVSRYKGGGAPAVDVGAEIAAGALGISISAQIRIVAHVANDLSITYTASVINLSGGITYGGIDTATYPGWVLVQLTLPTPLDDSKKVPLPGVHLNGPPVGPLGETVFLDVPPIPIQLDGVSASANMLVPIFGKGVANTDETIDVTYRLAIT